MKTCESASDPGALPRSHPWVDAVADAACRYYDLTATPALIRTSLEDFRPWSRYPAVEAFYALLERLNHEKSLLESNDCAFSGPAKNDELSVNKPLSCSGRLMLLFRALEQNTAQGPIDALAHRLHVELARVDEGFQWGIIGTTIVPVRYLALPEAREQQLGTQLMISFWAWGDTEADTMQNLGRLFKNLAHALRGPQRS